MSGIQERVSELPPKPGVYLFKDETGRILYIGKAASLRDRVGSYFSGSPGDRRIGTMLEQVRDLETVETGSEVEATLLEAKLIKSIQPKYNIRERDDKSFACLWITDDDDFPKVWFGRETDTGPAEKVGPFPTSGDVRRLIRILQKIFRFATCRLKIFEAEVRRRPMRPCLLYSIGRCTAPCAGLISRADYAADIASLRRFLRGERAELIESLRKQMRIAAGELLFERAAELRDQVAALEKLDEIGVPEDWELGDLEPLDPADSLQDLQRLLSLERPPRRIEACDIATLQGEDSVGSIVTFADGLPNKDGYRRFRIRGVRGVNDFEMIREVVRRRFARKLREGEALPDVFLVDGGRGQLSMAERAMGELGVRVPALLALAKEEETLYRCNRSDPVPAPKDSLGLRLLMHARDEAHRFAQRYHHLLRRKGMVR